MGIRQQKISPLCIFSPSPFCTSIVCTLKKSFLKYFFIKNDFYYVTQNFYMVNLNYLMLKMYFEMFTVSHNNIVRIKVYILWYRYFLDK